MPLISGAISVGANAVSTNQAAGTLEEFITRPSYVRLAAVQSATGLNFTLIIGRTALGNDQAIPTIGTSAVLPDNVIVEHAVNRGRNILTFRNTTAGALTATWRLDVVPLR
jgi:hypothetical protein